MSGWILSANDTASCPFFASPTTSISFVSLRKTVILDALRDDRLQLIHVSCPLPLIWQAD